MKFSENKKKYKGLKPKPQFPQNIDELLRGPAHFPNFGRLPDRTNTEFVRSREFAQLLADPFQDGDERSQTERRLEEVQALNRRVAQQQNIPVQQVNAVNPPAPPPRDEELFDAGQDDDPGWWQRWRGRADAAADIARGLFVRRDPPQQPPLGDFARYPALPPDFQPGQDAYVHPSLRQRMLGDAQYIPRQPAPQWPTIQDLPTIPGSLRPYGPTFEDLGYTLHPPSPPRRLRELGNAPWGAITLGPQHHEPLGQSITMTGAIPQLYDISTPAGSHVDAGDGDDDGQIVDFGTTEDVREQLRHINAELLTFLSLNSDSGGTMYEDPINFLMASRDAVLAELQRRGELTVQDQELGASSHSAHAEQGQSASSSSAPASASASAPAAAPTHEFPTDRQQYEEYLLSTWTPSKSHYQTLMSELCNQCINPNTGRLYEKSDLMKMRKEDRNVGYLLQLLLESKRTYGETKDTAEALNIAFATQPPKRSARGSRRA